MHGHFDIGYSKSTFKKHAFGRGRGSQKRVRCVGYARENDDNYGRPLTYQLRRPSNRAKCSLFGIRHGDGMCVDDNGMERRDGANRAGEE